MCDTTHDEIPTPCESVDKPQNQLLPTTRHIRDLNMLPLEVNTIQLWTMALQAHYKKNTHHPEHFTDPSQMDELSRKHMLCDLLASFWGSQRKHSVYDQWTLPKVANMCKDWSNWKLVQDLYTGSYDEESSKLVKYSRWYPKHYRMEKLNFHTFVKSFLRHNISKEEFIEGLYSFRCVHNYIEDLRWHQQTIVEVGKALFPEDEELQADLATHDDDKWDAMMIAAYVWKWLFKEEVMELDDRYDNKCRQCLIYRIIENGKENLKTMSKDPKKGYLFVLQKKNEENGSCKPETTQPLDNISSVDE